MSRKCDSSPRLKTNTISNVPLTRYLHRFCCLYNIMRLKFINNLWIGCLITKPFNQAVYIQTILLINLVNGDSCNKIMKT